MCAGEFLESYETQENEWDCVLTCFFIDTAPVVFEFPLFSFFDRSYIEVIHKILKPGGYWINLGPLLYHWQCTEDITMEEMDERYEQSFELSFEEIEEAMKRKGFKFEETRRVCTPYADNM